MPTAESFDRWHSLFRTLGRRRAGALPSRRRSGSERRAAGIAWPGGDALRDAPACFTRKQTDPSPPGAEAGRSRRDRAVARRTARRAHQGRAVPAPPPPRQRSAAGRMAATRHGRRARRPVSSPPGQGAPSGGRRGQRAPGPGGVAMARTVMGTIAGMAPPGPLFTRACRGGACAPPGEASRNLAQPGRHVGLRIASGRLSMGSIPHSG